MPRAQRMRWPMCAARLSVARPAACGRLMYAVFHPRRCMRKAVCVAILDQAVEQFAFIGNATKPPEIALERIGRIEMMRRLDQAEPRIPAEPADRHLQERAGRHVIRVKDRDVLSRRVGQRVVDVAGFRMRVVGARHFNGG